MDMQKKLVYYSHWEDEQIRFLNIIGLCSTEDWPGKKESTRSSAHLAHVWTCAQPYQTTALLCLTGLVFLREGAKPSPICDPPLLSQATDFQHLWHPSPTHWVSVPSRNSACVPCALCRRKRRKRFLCGPCSFISHFSPRMEENGAWSNTRKRLPLQNTGFFQAEPTYL